MGDEQAPLLAYATSATRPSFFRPLWAILPFSGGMFLGLLVAAGVLACQPDLSRPAPTFELWPLIVLLCLFLGWLFATAVLFLICCFSTRRLGCRRWQVTTSLGLASPLFLTSAGLLVHVISVVTASTQSVEDACLKVVMLLTAAIALATPFLLIRWRQSDTLPQRKGRQPRRLAMVVAGMVALEAALVVAWRWSEKTMLERDCVNLAAWVRTSYPLPAAHSDLVLPAPFRSLSGDGNVDAIVMPDGRVVLLLKTSLSWHHNWSGFIFATGPILPAEVGTDAYSRPQVTIHGLSDHFVGKQVDDRHFAVAFDLG
jgi:hypothetical protein